MVTRADILTAARSLLGTPFRWQARLPGIALDCAGVVRAIADQCGIALTDVTNYHKGISGARFLAMLHASGLVEIAVGAMEPGDIPVLWIPRGQRDPRAEHLGILEERGRFIHGDSDPTIAKVVRVPFEEFEPRVVTAFAFPGVV